MSSIESGFSFDNFQRNVRLQQNGLEMPKAMKTGTTICGVIFKDGVVLGADTRATEGPIVADKNCEKIHYMAPNIYCCGAGTSADTENTTAMVSSRLALHRLATNKQSRVATALTMLKRFLFKYQGYVSAALVLGGVDIDGPQLYTVYPHGSTDKLPFVTMGSGSLAAMAIFEAEFKDDMTEEEAKRLVHKAISSGIYNDLGSGSNVDLCVIYKDRVKFLRGYDESNQRKFRRTYDIPRGATTVLKESVYNIRKLVTVEDVPDSERDEEMAI